MMHQSTVQSSSSNITNQIHSSGIDDQIKWKYQYYSIFTRHKIFPKKFIHKIHSDYLEPQFKFNKITRSEYRNSNLYFKNYSLMKDQILKYLLENKIEILNTIFRDYEFKAS